MIMILIILKYRPIFNVGINPFFNVKKVLLAYSTESPDYPNDTILDCPESPNDTILDSIESKIKRSKKTVNRLNPHTKLDLSKKQLDNIKTCVKNMHKASTQLDNIKTCVKNMHKASTQLLKLLTTKKVSRNKKQLKGNKKQLKGNKKQV